MPKNNVVFRLVRYDEVIVIAPDRHLSTSSISTRLEDLVGNYRHDAPPQLLYRTSPKGCGRSSLRVKGALSYPQPGLAETAAANPLQWPHELGQGLAPMPRRFPPPWSVHEFAISYFYCAAEMVTCPV